MVLKQKMKQKISKETVDSYFRSKHQTLGAKVTLGTKTLTTFSNKSATFGIKVQT